MSDMLERTIALRNEAWAAVLKSPEFSAYAALDDAVGAMGGERRLAKPVAAVAHAPISPPRAYGGGPAIERRPSHGDAAAIGLRRAGKPLSVVELMQAARDAGGEIGGGDPLANFRSSLSKDARFKSVRIEGSYLWWFAGEPLPLGWKEAETGAFDDLLVPASDHSSQKGGDGHGSPATT